VVQKSQGGHPTATSELGASYQTIIGDPRRHNDLFGISGAYLAIPVVQNFEIGPVLGHRAFSMRHKLDLHPVEFSDQLIHVPADGRLLHLLVGFEVLVGEEVVLHSHEGKFFDEVIDLLPHAFGIDDELEHPAVFESNQQFEAILLIHVFVQFVDFADRKTYQTVLGFDEDLVITEDEGHIFVFAVDELASHEFVVY